MHETVKGAVDILEVYIGKIYVHEIRNLLGFLRGNPSKLHFGLKMRDSRIMKYGNLAHGAPVLQLNPRRIFWESVCGGSYTPT